MGGYPLAIALAVFGVVLTFVLASCSEEKSPDDESGLSKGPSITFDWGKDPGRLVVDDEVELNVCTEHDFARAKEDGLEASLAAPGLEVISVKLKDDEGKATFVFELRAQSPAFQKVARISLMKGEDLVAPVSAGYTVEMPTFFDTGEQSFIEMVSAPEASIYGSHITAWTSVDRSDLMMVTGHAASNVCRVASAALFGLAYHSDIDSDLFFLGAGLGSLNIEGLREEIDTMYEKFSTDYPELVAGIGEIAADQNRRLSFAISLSAPDIHEVRAEAIREQLKPFSSALLSDWTRDLGIENQELDQLAGRIKSLSEGVGLAEPLSDEQVAELQVVMAVPITHIIAARGRVDAEVYDELLAQVSDWPVDRQERMKADLAALVEKGEAAMTVRNDLADLEARTGLLTTKELIDGAISTTAAVERIRGNVANWGGDARVGEVVELAALAAGFEGCVLLPFLSKGSEPMVFKVPATALSGGARDEEWQRLLQSSTAQELVNSAKQAKQRLDKLYTETLERIEIDYRAPFQDLNALKVWGSRTRDVTINLIDEVGRPAGTRHETRSTVSLLLDAWETASNTGQTAYNFGRTVEANRKMENDPKFRKISDSCLIDSLLRGWKLAFSDDEMERNFESWSIPTRTRIWEEIWQQAQDAGHDLRPLFAGATREGTVFQVKREGGDYVITPLFVASVLEARCVALEGGGVSFSSPWFDREIIPFENSNVASTSSVASDAAPEKLADEMINTAEKQIDSLLDKIGLQVSQGQRLERVSEALESLHSSEISENLRLALNSAPEHAVGRLVVSLLDLWDELPVAVAESENQVDQDEAKIDRERLASLERLYASGGDLQSSWDEIGGEIESGEWPFVDEYLLFAKVWAGEADGLEANAAKETNSARKAVMLSAVDSMLERVNIITANGVKIDSGYMAAKDTDAISALRLRIERERLGRGAERGITIGMRAISLLSEAERALDEWDDSGQIDYLIEQFSGELGRSSRAASLAEQKQSIGAYLDEGSDDLSVLASRRDSMLSALKLLSKPVSDQLSDWRIAYKADYLLQRFKRASAKGNKSTKKRVLAALNEAIETLNDSSEEIPWLKELSKTKGAALRDLYDEIVRKRYYGALDRQGYRHELSEQLGDLAGVIVTRIERQHRTSPNRRSLEMLVQIQWQGGDYRSALRLVADQTRQYIQSRCFPGDSATEEAYNTAGEDVPLRVLEDAGIRSRLFEDLEKELLKACVYSGGEFFGASIFGRRVNDWARKPVRAGDAIVELRRPSAARLSRENEGQLVELANSVKAGGNFKAGVEIGPFKILSSHRSFTDLVAFRVEDRLGYQSIVKVAPVKDAETMLANNRVADHLAREGADVALPLPVGRDGAKLVSSGNSAITRETLAKGEQLSEIAARGKEGLSPELQKMHSDATLDLFVKGADISDRITSKKAVRNTDQMKEWLQSRGDLGKQYFDLFEQSGAYKGEQVSVGKGFQAKYNDFVETLWSEEKPLSEIGLVHDAIHANYFLDGNKLKAIDLGDDYVGSVGHSISIIMTQRQRPKGLRTYEQFKADVDSLIADYSKKIGRELTDEQQIEIVQHLSFHPYKFLSSDTKSFLNSLKEQWGLPRRAGVDELRVTAAEGGNGKTLVELLENPAFVEKNKRYLRQIKHSLQLLEELLPTGKKLDSTKALRQSVKEAIEIGIRVTGTKLSIELARTS